MVRSFLLSLALSNCQVRSCSSSTIKKKTAHDLHLDDLETCLIEEPWANLRRRRCHQLIGNYLRDNSIINLQKKEREKWSLQPPCDISFVDSSQNIEDSVSHSLESSNRVVVQSASFESGSRNHVSVRNGNQRLWATVRAFCGTNRISVRIISGFPERSPSHTGFAHNGHVVMHSGAVWVNSRDETAR